MNVVINEMKKIWNPTLLLAIAVICILIIFSVRWNFTPGPPEANSRALNALMTNNYGTKLSENDFIDFLEIRNMLIKKADGYILKMPIFAEAGIFSYVDFNKDIIEYGLDNVSEAKREAFWTLYSAECEFVGVELIIVDNIEGRYSISNEWIENQISIAATDHARNRLSEIQNTGEYLSIMDEYIFNRTQNYMIVFAVLTLLSSLILVSPLVVTDRARNVHTLQYSSKQGRHVLAKQFIAVLLSSFLLTSIYFILFMVIYVYYSGDFVFWNNGLTSFESLSRYVMRFPVTLGQYIIVSIILIYIINAGVSILATVISRFSNNYVVIVLKLLPTFITSIMLWIFIKGRLLLLIDTPLGNKWLEFLISGFVFLICVIVVVLVVKREKRIDIV